MAISLRTATLLLAPSLCVGLAACSAGPTLEDAKELLEEGNPENALTAARGAADRARTKQDRISLRRVAFYASLNAGWSHEAATEYLRLRELTGQDEPGLLRHLGRSTLALGRENVDAGRRLWSVRALRTFLDEEEAGEPLATSLADPAPSVRAEAVDVAARLPEVGAALDLLRRHASDEEPQVRGAVLRAARVHVGPRLSAADPAAWRDAVGLSLRGASDPNADVRLAALELAAFLEAGGQGELRATLVGGVANGDDAVSRRSAQLVLARDPQRAWDAWAAAHPGLGPFGRSLGLHVGRITPDTVREDLAAEDYRERLVCVQGLAGPGAERLRTDLYAVLARDPVAAVRVAALDALLQAGGATARRALRLGARNELGRVRLRAFSIAESREPHDVDALVELLDDPALAAEVAPLLLARGGERGTRVVVDALRAPSLRLACARALAALSDPDLREVYVRLLEDDDPRARYQGAVGLAACGQAEDLVRLVRAIERPTGNADLPAAASLLLTEDRVQANGPTSGTSE